MNGFPHHLLLNLTARMEGLEFSNDDLRRLSNPKFLRQVKLVLDGQAEVVELSGEPLHDEGLDEVVDERLVEYIGGQSWPQPQKPDPHSGDHDFGDAEREYGVK